MDPAENATATHIERVAGVRGQAIRFDGDFGVFFRDIFPVERWDPFSLDFYLRDTVRNRLPVVVLQKSRGTDCGYNGFDVMLTDGIIELRMYRVWPGNGIGVRAVEPINRDAWQHLTVTYDGSSQARGLRLFLDGKEMPTTVLRDRIHKIAVGVGRGKGYLTLGERFRDRGFQGGEIDELRVFDRGLVPLEVQHLHDGRALADAVSNPQLRRTALEEFYISAIDDEVRACRSKLRDARQALAEAEEPIQEVPVMEELAAPRATYILPAAPTTHRRRTKTGSTEIRLRQFSRRFRNLHRAIVWAWPSG